MTEVATKMAVARKAISEILAIEDMLRAQGADTATLKRAMTDVATLARISGKSANEAVKILKKMAADIEAYMEETEGATY